MAETAEQIAQKVLKLGLCTEEQVREGLQIQQKMRDLGINPKPLPEVLLDRCYLTQDQFREISPGEKTEKDKSSLEKDSITGYEILSKIGQGGMGAVFRARQLSMDQTS